MTQSMTRLSTTVALVVMAAVTAHVQARLPRPPGAHVVTITPPGETGSEPAIAINPNNPNQVVGVAGRWAAYSTDGGRTFSPPAAVDGSGPARARQLKPVVAAHIIAPKFSG